MPATSALLVSCAVALSFAATVSAGVQVDTQGASGSLHRIVRRQSHGIERAADELVARDTKAQAPVNKKEERQVVECGQGLQIALSTDTSPDGIVNACQHKVKRAYDSRLKARRLATPEEEDALEEQKRWVLTDWYDEDDEEDFPTQPSNEDEDEDISTQTYEAPSVKDNEVVDDKISRDGESVDIEEMEAVPASEVESVSEFESLEDYGDDYEEESYAPYRGESRGILGPAKTTKLTWRWDHRDQLRVLR
jgi:hypothetical protein